MISETFSNHIDMIKDGLLQQNINIKTEGTERNHKIYGYSNALMQVLINLIHNAKDALQENQVKDKEIIVIILENDHHIEIHIIDNAGGIPEAIIDEIFDPYFSTKTEKNGTGLGLYMGN